MLIFCQSFVLTHSQLGVLLLVVVPVTHKSRFFSIPDELHWMEWTWPISPSRAGMTLHSLYLALFHHWGPPQAANFLVFESKKSPF